MLETLPATPDAFADIEELVLRGSAQSDQRIGIGWITSVAAVSSTFYEKKKGEEMKGERRKERRGYITSELYF